MRTAISLLAALALLAGCGEDEASEPTSLDDGADAVHLNSDDSSEEAGEPSGDQAAREDGQEQADPAADDDAETDPSQSTDTVIDVQSDHPVEAQPGRWAVLDAGFVEFDLTDAGLALVEVTEAEGWSAVTDEESPDEIEVELRRKHVEHEIEIELDDGVLEIDLDTDIEPAEAGVYDIGTAGSVELALEDGQLRLVDVVVSEGWDLSIDDESSDEIELTLRSGDERWKVESELDDGVLDAEIDYEVRGSAGS